MKHYYLLSFTMLLSFVGATFYVSALTCTTLTKSFSRRSEGEHVFLLQYFLADTGHLLVTPNGYFGPATFAAVKRFQVSIGLPPVGTVGPMTRKKIKDISCVTNVAQGQETATSSLVTITTTTSATTTTPQRVATTTENIPKNNTSTTTATTTQPVVMQSQEDRENALTRNAKRQNDITNLHIALGKYIEDNNLVLPYGITSRPTELCSAAGYSCSGKVDLGSSLGRYISQIPKDSKATGANGTGYLISKNSNDVITISAPYAEEGKVIMMSR